MARPATGTVIETATNRGTSYALRFTAYKVRRFVTLGTEADGWTRDRAQAELQNVMADVRRGRWTPPNPAVESAPAPTDDPTFHEFASEWFEMVESERKASTADAIRWRLSYVLLPYFKAHRLSQITTAEVDRYRMAQVRERDRLAAARDRGEDIERRPLSNSTINRTIGLLAQILELAVEYGHIDVNPASGKRRKLKADRPQRAYLDSAAQITALLDAAAELDKGSRADRQHVNRRGQLATLIFAGLRISEFLALRWGDVDLAGGWITVRQSKTHAGRRKVKIRPVLRDVLADHRPLDASPGAYVFGTAAGKQQNPSNVRTRVLAKAVERASERLVEADGPPLPRLTPHGLRRTFASLLYGIGEPPPVVMAEMGHEDPQEALSVYAQAMRRDDGEKDRLRALVEGAPIGSNGSGGEIEAPAMSPERVR
jgi:integrase